MDGGDGLGSYGESKPREGGWKVSFDEISDNLFGDDRGS
jgi:hypothetical protein